MIRNKAIAEHKNTINGPWKAHHVRRTLNAITIPIMIFVMAIMVILVFVNFEYSDEMVEQQATQEYINIINSKWDMIDGMFNRILSLIYNAFQQEETLDVISGSSSGYDKFEDIKAIKEMLLYDRGFGDEYELFYYGDNGIDFYKSDSIFKDTSSFINTSWYKTALASPSELYWFGLRKSELQIGAYSFIGSLRIEINDYRRGYLKGVAFFSIDDIIMQSVLKNIGGSIYIINRDGIIIYDMRKEFLGYNVSSLGINYAQDIPAGSQYSIKTIQAEESIWPASMKNTIAIISPLNAYGLSLVLIRDQLSIVQKYQSLQLMIYVFFLIVLIFIFYYAIIYIFAINKPIENLYRKVINKNVEDIKNSGVLSDINPVTSGLRKIDIEFNRIIMENRNSLDRISEIERTEQLMEIKKLQAEIDPHFLFNVLGHVKFAAMLDNPNQIVKMIDALFVILNSKKAQVDHFITVREEIEVVEKYIDILKIIYEDNISYSFDIDPQILDCSIPAFILQPIIENCIHHGINPGTGGGKISINGKCQGEDILFEVIDNGMGIQEHAIEKIMQYHIETDNKANKHMGIMNIDKKIKLCCGNEYGIRIESKYSQGTKVMINLKNQLN